MAWLIPPELMYLIIDRYHSEDPKTLMQLCLTCRALAPYCRQCIFRSVKINTREPGNRPCQADLFARAIEESPDILDLIEVFCLRTHGLRDDHDSFGRILSPRMKNLRRFELKSNYRSSWHEIPSQLADVLSSIIRSPTIVELSLEGVEMPINLLCTFTNLKVIDILLGGVCEPSWHRHDKLSVDRLKPSTLTIRDSTFNGRIIELCLGERSPFSLSSIQALDIILPERLVHTLRQPLQACTSLTALKLLLITEKEGVPKTLDLSDFPNATLTSLTLSADITMMGYRTNPSSESVARFDWLSNTLRTIPSTSHIREITLVIRTPSLEKGLRWNWEAFDDIFRVAEGWPVLSSFKIIWSTRRINDILLNESDRVSLKLPSILPNLSRIALVKMHTTFGDEVYNFWSIAINERS